MRTQRNEKLNRLAKHLPEGMTVDSAWLRKQGYSANLLRKYEVSGWLQQPAHRIYVRPRGPIVWEQAVISLQTLLARDLVIEGRTALEQHGFAHYLQRTTSAIYLSRATKGRPDSIIAKPWGPWNWALMTSSPERAILELLDELPDNESFHQIDMLMEGLTTLSPTRLQKLLADCRNVKVKRLFFFFADRHQHAWLKRLDRKPIDLGRGKRMLVKGGRYDAKYLITVPGDLDGVH